MLFGKDMLKIHVEVWFTIQKCNFLYYKPHTAYEHSFKNQIKEKCRLQIKQIIIIKKVLLANRTAI